MHVYIYVLKRQINVMNFIIQMKYIEIQNEQRYFYDINRM